VYKAALE